jgi:hypothetical protein
MVAGSSFARHSLDPAEALTSEGPFPQRSRLSIVVSVATAHQAAKVRLSTALAPDRFKDFWKRPDARAAQPPSMKGQAAAQAGSSFLSASQSAFDPDPKGAKAKVESILPPTRAAFNAVAGGLSCGAFFWSFPHSGLTLASQPWAFVGPFLFEERRPGLRRGAERDRA